MSSRVTPEHAATMRRHYAESIDLGVSPTEIHRELRDEIFIETGRYSIQEITATTSWIARETLRDRRVNEIDWNEGSDDTNEDADFDNPEKNSARDWQVQQLLKHTTLEQRQDMNYLLLPGKNEYDFEAFTNAGLQGKNFLTYILGKHPKAVAHYIRNCRKYGVQNKRIGAMNDHFLTEQVTIRGAYIDYFSQFCPDTSLDAHLLPLDPNYYPICVGLNFKKGREHRSTRENASQSRERRMYVDSKQSGVKDGADLTRLFFEAMAKTENIVDGYEMKELRDELIYHDMFLNMGVAQQKNWPAPDLLKEFIKQTPGNEDLNDLPLIEQYIRAHEALKTLIGVVGLVDEFRHTLGVHFSLPWTGGAVCRAAVNAPVVRHLAKPFSYTSGESNKPFQSYFGVIETRKDQYQKHIRAMEFIFSLGKVLIERIQNIDALGPINIHDLLKVSGVGSKKKITVLQGSKSKPISEINHDYLLEAQLELGAAGCSMTHHNAVSFESLRKNDEQLVKDAKARGVHENRLKKFANSIRQDAQTSGIQKIRRNDPCPCGSGKKFKRCCQ